LYCILINHLLHHNSVESSNNHLITTMDSSVNNSDDESYFDPSVYFGCSAIVPDEHLRIIKSMLLQYWG